MKSIPFSPSDAASILIVASLTFAGLVACDRSPGPEDDGPTSGEETGTTTLPGTTESPAPSNAGPGGKVATTAETRAALTDPQQRLVVEAVAEVLGTAPETIAMDQPIIDPAKGIEEFELLDILLGIEDRFDIEISEDAIERATGGRFDDVQKQLTPRQLVSILSEAKSK